MAKDQRKFWKDASVGTGIFYNIWGRGEVFIEPGFCFQGQKDKIS
jgi:hypothetical protein